MMISESTATLPTPQNHWFGVGITTVGENNHCGVVFFDTSDETRKIFHLAFHNILRINELKEDYRWVKLSEFFEEDNARDFANLCKWIQKNNEDNVPYGIKHDKAMIMPATGLFDLAGGDGVGATCSTWTMLVFRAFGIDLVDLSTWSVREDDSEWHNFIVQTLRENGVPEQHVESVKLENPCTRIRPEEIASSCNVPEKPVAFSVVEPLGKKLHAELRA